MSVTGASPSASPGAAQSASSAGKTEAPDLSQEGQVNNKNNDASLSEKQQNQNALMCSNMSTQDFVSLSSLSASPVEEDMGNMKDIKDMMKMVIALQILQKVVEATSEILEGFMSGESGGTDVGKL